MRWKGKVFPSLQSASGLMLSLLRGRTPAMELEEKLKNVFNDKKIF